MWQWDFSFRSFRFDGGRKPIPEERGQGLLDNGCKFFPPSVVKVDRVILTPAG